MKTAKAKAKFLSELQVMVHGVTNAVIGDAILVLLMLATLIF